MYNEALKKRFIESYTESEATAGFCISLFEAVSRDEEKAEADISAWSPEALKPVLERISRIRSIDRQPRLYVLKRYAKWCVENGVDGATLNLCGANVTGLSKIREYMVSGPGDLQNYLNAVFESEAEQSTDSVYRCGYWLAFMGVDKEDAVALRRSDVDLAGRSLICSGKRIALYEASLGAFRNCSELTAFRYREKWWPRIENTMLLSAVKAVYTTEKLKVAMSAKAKKAFDAGLTSKRLSYERVEQSGLFYRMKEREMAGYGADFSEATEEFMRGREYKLDKNGGTIESIRGRILSDYEKDYRQWKMAFLV